MLIPTNYRCADSIARSSSHQENVHFINDIAIFKAKDPQSFDVWLEQIDKVASLTNKEQAHPCEVPRLFSRIMNSCPPILEGKKFKKNYYNFGSVATKQHAASMLTDQQQKSSETAQECVQRFSG